MKMRGKAGSVFLVAGFLAVFMAQSARADIDIGKPAPALSVQEFDGSNFDLKTLMGRVVVMNFWATWCGPCREEMPELSAFNHDYEGQGVTVIGLSVDTHRRRSDAIEVAKAFHIPGAMLDETKTSGFQLPSYIPITYVIDKKGIVRARLVPNEVPLTENALADIVKPLLEDEAKPEDKPADKDPKSGGEAKQ